MGRLELWIRVLRQRAAAGQPGGGIAWGDVVVFARRGARREDAGESGGGGGPGIRWPAARDAGRGGRAPRHEPDLAISLDVISHLTEDAVFEAYMRHLFAAAAKFVIVFATNRERPGTAPHVRHRRFTRWVETDSRGWQLLDVAPGPNHGPDRADFFTYERVGPPAVGGQH